MITDARARRQGNGKDNKCSKCNYKTVSITLLNTHVNWCSKTKETKVNNGNDENKTKIESKDNTKSKRIHCKKCERKFNKESTFNMHMKNAHEETSIKINNKESQVNVTFHTEKRNLRSNKKSSSAQGPNN